MFLLEGKYDMRVIQMRNKPNEFSGLIPKCLHEEPYSSIFSLQFLLNVMAWSKIDEGF
jgi:hypothetical protein